MTLDQLKQVKQDLADKMIVSPGTWVKVLDAAIEGATSRKVPLNLLYEIGNEYTMYSGEYMDAGAIDAIATHLLDIYRIEPR